MLEGLFHISITNMLILYFLMQIEINLLMFCYFQKPYKSIINSIGDAIIKKICYNNL
jgi:hypothetical protein